MQGQPARCLRGNMLLLERANVNWWNKPLALHHGLALPAELVILDREVRFPEQGAWLNSRGTKSGVIGLRPDAGGRLRTVRIELPKFVSEALAALYCLAGVTKGCPDLVIWDLQGETIRLVEVKCRDWDAPSAEQAQFLATAGERGIAAAVVEWRFL
jgi:VRR-NUC domain